MGGEKSLGKSIQAARKAAGLTQQDLCGLVDVSYSTLAKIERDAIASPSVFTVHAIALATGTTIDALLLGAGVDTVQSASTIEKKTSKSGVKFIYFDINGVLVRFFHAAFSALSEKSGVPIDSIESTFWHYNDAVCRGDMTIDDFNESLAARLDIDRFDWRDYYDEAAESLPEMHSLLTWASQHYKVGLLSNIMPGQIERMIASGKLPNISYDAIIDSSVVGSIKPEEGIYHSAQAAAQVDPSEILFIDDSRANLMAAEHLGWRVTWFDDYRPAESAERIKSSLEF